jgi:hypothetical protein
MELFEESDEEAREDISTLKTNKGYAKHYDEFRKKELLSHCKFFLIFLLCGISDLAGSLF